MFESTRLTPNKRQCWLHCHQQNLKFSFFYQRRRAGVKGRVATKNVLQHARRLWVFALTDAVQKGYVDITWATFSFSYISRILNIGCWNAGCLTLLVVRWSAIDKLMTLVPILIHHWIGMQTIEKKYLWEFRFINSWIRLCQRYFKIFWQQVTSRFSGTANTCWWSTHQYSW